MPAWVWFIISALGITVIVVVVIVVAFFGAVTDWLSRLVDKLRKGK